MSEKEIKEVAVSEDQSGVVHGWSLMISDFSFGTSTQGLLSSDLFIFSTGCWFHK